VAALNFFRNFARDPVLVPLLFIMILQSITEPVEHLGRMVLLGPMGYSQASASVMGMVSPPLGGIGAFLGARLVKGLGLLWTFTIALVLQLAGFGLVGLCMPFLSSAGGLLFWSGTALNALSGGMVHTVSNAILSIRVEEDEQGMLFSFAHLLEKIGGIIGVQILMKRMFNSKDVGWMGGRTFFVAAGLTAVSLVSLGLIALQDKRKCDAISKANAEEAHGKDIEDVPVKEGEVDEANAKTKRKDIDNVAANESDEVVL
jgi:hypothetical protein